MNNKKLFMFLVIAYAMYWVGGMAVDYMAPIIPTLFTGLIGEILRFVIPTTLVYWGWLKFGKGS